MKRRTFIQYAAAAIGSASIPIKGSGQSIGKFTELLKIPREVHHIRHGTFAMTAYSNPLLPAWLKLFESHRLLADGLEPGPDDLHTFSFAIRSNTYTLAYNSGMCSLIAQEMHATLHEKSGVINFAHGRIFKGEVPDGSVHAGFLAVLSGKVNAGNAIIEQGEFMVNEEPMRLWQSGDDALSIAIQGSLR